MRQAFKAQIQVNGRRFLVLGLNEVFGFVQALVLQPLAGWRMKGLLKIAFETGKAAAGELGKLFYRDVEVIIAYHEPFQVDLMGFGKIK